MRPTARFSLALACCLLLPGLSASAQRNYNLELLAHVPFPDEGERGNDCWGYATDEGVEYAIIGSTAATYIYALDEGDEPVLRARIPGANSTWRDMKSYGSYVYVVADEGADGLLVIDMSGAPSSITHAFYRPEVRGTTLTQAHNLYISAEGLLVLAGGNLGAGEPHFFDLTEDPEAPPFVGAARRVYAHDVYAEGGRLYSSDIYAGELAIHDYTDLTDIRVLGTRETSSAFTHNAWSESGGEFAFTTDERTGASVDAYDVTDAGAIRRVDRFRPDETFGSGSIPHNTHVRGDYLVTSWYRDGVVVADATRPHNLIEVGKYDTYPQGGGSGFDGCWGAYPFLPSGRVIASDIQRGLFVFDAVYEQGCYFEGTVQDSLTGELLAGVTVDLDGRPAQRVETGADGAYATGLYDEGRYTVTYSRPGYVTRRASAELRRGELDYRNVVLRPLIESTFDVTARDEDGGVIPDAVVAPIYRATEGDANRYDVYVARWGFRPYVLRDTLLPEGTAVTLDVTLARGYADDFTADLGWETSGTALRGLWNRGAPEETVIDDTVVQLGRDVGTDFGEAAYGTDVSGGAAGAGDVDGGTAVLTSPPIELAADEDGFLDFAYYFAVRGGTSPPDDELVVELTNGTQTVTLLRERDNTPDYRRFRSASVRTLLGAEGGPLEGPLDDLRVVVTTSDLPRSGHLVEALFDDFSLVLTPVGRPRITPALTEACAPATVTLELAVAPPGATVVADGATDVALDGTTITLTYPRPGTYDLRIDADDADGAAVTYEYPGIVRVDTTPTASFETAALGDLRFAFTSTSTGAARLLWDFGDGDLSTRTNPVHRYREPGDYLVTLTAASACGEAVATATVGVVVGLTELRAATGLRLAANPVSDRLSLVYEGEAPIDVRLSDALGRVVLSRERLGPGQHHLPVGDLPEGVYFLHAPGRAPIAATVVIRR